MTLADLEKRGSVRPHIAAHIRSQQAMLERMMVKHAGRQRREFGKRAAVDWGTFLATVGAGVAVPLAIEGINKGVSAVRGAVSKGSNFRGMMEANPELKQLDRNKVQRAFNTLHRFNPDMSGDPLVAGTFVKRVADYDMIDHKTVGELASARKSLVQAGEKENLLQYQPMNLPTLRAEKTSSAGKTREQLRSAV